MNGGKIVTGCAVTLLVVVTVVIIIGTLFSRNTGLSGVLNDDTVVQDVQTDDGALNDCVSNAGYDGLAGCFDGFIASITGVAAEDQSGDNYAPILAASRQLERDAGDPSLSYYPTPADVATWNNAEQDLAGQLGTPLTPLAL